MTFLDYQLESRLEKHLDHTSTTSTFSLDEFSKTSKETIDSWLSKERFIEINETQNDPSKKHFFHEFPRKQSNNDLQYHNDDTVMTFLVDYFFISKPKK
jgi:hypothetical protein